MIFAMFVKVVLVFAVGSRRSAPDGSSVCSVRDRAARHSEELDERRRPICEVSDTACVAIPQR